MSYKKIIEAKNLTTGGLTEYEGLILQEIYHKHRGQDVDLYLAKYTHNGIGWVYVDHALIGNCKGLLGNEDYWQAYDKLF